MLRPAPLEAFTSMSDTVSLDSRAGSPMLVPSTPRGQVNTATLQWIFVDLRSSDRSRRTNAAAELRQHVEAEAREMVGERFVKYMTDLNRKLFELVNSDVVDEKLGGIGAIDQLIDLESEDNSTKITRFANYLRMSLPNSSVPVMEAAAKALGHLARAGGTLTADFVEFEVRRALEWLRESARYEHRRHASVLVLREFARNVPSLFNVHVEPFFSYIWVALRDTNLAIREAAIGALSSTLELTARRESDARGEWYYKLFEEARSGCQKNKGQADSIHGSLMTIGELLSHAPEFMGGRLDEACDLVLYFRENRNSLVRSTVIKLIPRLAQMRQSDTTQDTYYLSKCVNHLLLVLRQGSDRPLAFTALGDLAMATPKRVVPNLRVIASLIRDSTVSRSTRKTFCVEAVVCTGKLTQALGEDFRTCVSEVFDALFNGGLSKELVAALGIIVEKLPDMKERVQYKLLNAISMTLIGQPYVGFDDAADQEQGAVPTGTDAEINIKLALSTLSSFNFDPISIMQFMDPVIELLDDQLADMRYAAAMACSRMLLRVIEGTDTRGFLARQVSDAVGRLLQAGIADGEGNIRGDILASLKPQFDAYLSQATNIRSLSLALNDEIPEIRLSAVEIVGRLTDRNPAHVLPELRTRLVQLLAELEEGDDSTTEAESALLLGRLIGSSPRLARPYVTAILKALTTRLESGKCNATTSANMLGAVAELARVGPMQLEAQVDRLLQLTIDALQDQSNLQKREIAVRTLGQLVEHTGCVIEPYFKFEALLPTLLETLATEPSWAIRKEVIKVCGILGAVDPYQWFMRTSNKAERQSSLVTNAPKGVGPGVSPSSPDFYSTVAIGALIRILKDESLSNHRNMVAQAVMHIFRTQGRRQCVPFLKDVVPPVLNVMRSCEPGLREFLFQQLGDMVPIVKQHIRVYLDQIVELIVEHLQVRDIMPGEATLNVPVLTLVEKLVVALGDEFKQHLKQLVPQMLCVLRTDHSQNRHQSLRLLRALEMCGSNLDGHLHMVIPEVVPLFLANPAPVEFNIAAIQTVGRLCVTTNCNDFASRIVHSLVRVLSNARQGGPRQAKPKAEQVVALQTAAVTTLCDLIFRIGSTYTIFEPTVKKVMIKLRYRNERYESLIACLAAREPFPLSLAPKESVAAVQTPAASDTGTTKKNHVNQENLRRAWETSQRSTVDDWAEWHRRFSVELLRESSSPALRACSALAQVYHPLANELFNAGFVSCWSELQVRYQQDLVKAIESAFLSKSITPDILQRLLNLAEFMEHDENPLPIDIRTLGGVAKQCHAYAKLLHYTELEFITSPGTATEELITVNTKLGQQEAAVGSLKVAQDQHGVTVETRWYERLNRYDEALAAYQERRGSNPMDKDATIGIMRCLTAMGDWRRLSEMSREVWSVEWASTEVDEVKQSIAPMAAAAAWGLEQWDDMEEYVSCIRADSVDTGFYSAVFCIHDQSWDAALVHIDRTRELLDKKLTALVGESYNRSYKVMVTVQQLAELEEIIEYKQSKDIARQERLRGMWDARLQGAQRHVLVWLRLLSVRRLVVPVEEDAVTYVKLVSLCCKSGELALARKALASMLNIKSSDIGSGKPIVAEILSSTSISPRVVLSFLKFLFLEGDREMALEHLEALIELGKGGAGGSRPEAFTDRLVSKLYRKCSSWHKQLGLTRGMTPEEILKPSREAKDADPSWYKAWHSWGRANYDLISVLEQNQSRRAGGKSASKSDQTALLSYITAAIGAFFQSIILSPDDRRNAGLQDILRLITLWFRHGKHAEVNEVIAEGLEHVSVDTWLQVIPQLIARIHSPTVKDQIFQLLCRIGEKHQQALIYPLAVAATSVIKERATCANEVMDKMKGQNPTLVEQAQLVAKELIRVAILWHEQWHEGLEEASRLYFGDRNVDGMFKVLAPLHEMMAVGPQTMRESSFQQAFGLDLEEAHEWCSKYKRSKKDTDLNQAWDLYYHVFRRINKQLPQMTQLELQLVSPKLLEAKDMELAVPGTYRAGQPIVKIQSFAPSLTVITSKQRPRKMTLNGSDGRTYMFLLKGHEDIRQDERVMQLLGLINGLLENDHDTSNRDLNIRRYDVVPLSPNSGLIGWVAHHDTLHALIRDYRESHKIMPNIEHRLMLQMAPDYDRLSLIQKVEVFDYALSNTNGEDLKRVLWLKSRNAETWLDRRTNYTRSLACMSIVGYILGLGDRHPSNLLLDRVSGKMLHIDFGDCFEVAIHREKFPEKIPFRLTRMLVKAMEVSGIESNFRLTCESVMRVLRQNRSSVMAMLEAFVYDPLINWRLGSLKPAVKKRKAAGGDSGDDSLSLSVDGYSVGSAFSGSVSASFQDESMLNDGSVGSMSGSMRGMRRAPSTQYAEMGAEGSEQESRAVNEKAVEVIKRVSNKLKGRDFADADEPLDVKQQVQRLIDQATLNENLCQCYIGWCPFW